MVNRTAIIKQPDNISFFNDVYKLQKEYQEALILDNSNPNFVWIGEHQLCYTLGRGSNYDNLLFSLNDDKYDVFKIDRGGEVTCHMPGQLVTYLVLDLKNFNKDLNWYLRKIEEIIIKILGTFNIDCHSRKGFTGVWIGNKKIASIGIGCKRWITINGFSINIDCELENFNKIADYIYVMKDGKIIEHGEKLKSIPTEQKTLKNNFHLNASIDFLTRSLIDKDRLFFELNEIEFESLQYH